MSLSRFSRTLLFAAIVVLPGCGGGGSAGSIASVTPTPAGHGGGIGGSGATSSGTIDAFGSIFVNGVEFETGDAEIILNGESVGENALGLGMVVLVKGTVNDDGVTGTATQVVFDNEVKGPVTDIQIIDGGDAKVLAVLGGTVIVERTGTVFEDVSFDTLGVDDLLEVSGFRDDNQRLRATRVERKSGFIGGVSEIELKGMVESISGTEFTFGIYTVDTSGADLSEVPGGSLQNGMMVEVKGTLDGSLITATKVEADGDIAESFDENGDVNVQGTITNFVDDTNFTVSGVPVDASSAKLTPSGLGLAAGMVVEAEGHWDGSTLIADKVESRRGRIEIEATVASVTANSITLQLFGGTLTVEVDNQTLLDDDTDMVGTLVLADISVGDFLEVEAVQLSDSLLATRVDRDDMDDDALQAPVDSFVSGSSLTLLGISYQTIGADFKNQNDTSATEAEFYALLTPGMLVKIKDREIADGVADEVEFKSDIKFSDDGFDGHDDGDDDSEHDDDSCSDQESCSGDDMCSGDDQSDDSCSDDQSGMDDNSMDSNESMEQEDTEDFMDSEDTEAPEDPNDPQDSNDP